MPLISTRGAASAQGFGEFAQSAAPVYIEDVFSTYLYTGTGSTQTITNGINLSGNGGMVWFKNRGSASGNHWLFDSARNNFNNILLTNTTDAQLDVSSYPYDIDPTASGFTVKGTAVHTNANANTYASWTFRKAEKFFDVVTYTGTGSNRTVAHNLGSVPGCIIVKRTDSGGTSWAVYHRSLGATQDIALNSTAAAGASTLWNSTGPTSTVFSLGTLSAVNASGGTYVAYLFAHDAGGFGLSGTDNVISCGSWTGTGTSPGPTITLGWEPQLILYKRASGGTGDWGIHDNMRSLGVGTSSTSGSGNRLEPNTADAETGSSNFANISATGFTITPTVADINASGSTYIYIAIRRGPMKVPTSGTSVFKPFTYNNSAGGFTQTQNAGFPTDFALESDRINPANHYLVSRLQGPRAQMASNSTLDEASYNTGVDQQKFDLQNLFAQQNSIDTSVLLYCFRRAPGFFDIVCYTGTGSARTVDHNLAAVPELMIVKIRSGSAASWAVYYGINTAGAYLNSNVAAFSSVAWWNSTSPTSSQFTLGTTGVVNASGSTYVAYLFATVAGVSKVGSYTGSGTTNQIDCGFTAGARFVLIKRTDSTGDWYVYDSARGIVAGNDPYLFLNSTAAEVTSTDYVDTYSAGFELSSTAPAGLNANGGTYIFLAIA